MAINEFWPMRCARFPMPETRQLLHFHKCRLAGAVPTGNAPCEVDPVWFSPSGYYGWVKRWPSGRARADAELTEQIRAAHAGSRGTYGAPRVHAELAAKGIRAGRRHGRAAGLSNARQNEDRDAADEELLF